MTTWAITQYRRFPVAIRPRRVMQVNARIKRKAKLERDRQKAIERWIAMRIFEDRHDHPWWRRFL